MKTVLATCAHCNKQVPIALGEFVGNPYAIDCPECGGKNDTTLLSKLASILTGVGVMGLAFFLASKIWPTSALAMYLSAMVGLFAGMRPAALVGSLVPRLVKHKPPWPHNE